MLWPFINKLINSVTVESAFFKFLYEIFPPTVNDMLENSKLFYNSAPKVGAAKVRIMYWMLRCSSKTSKRLKEVVLLYLWRTIVKQLGGFSNISSADFCIYKVARDQLLYLYPFSVCKTVTNVDGQFYLKNDPIKPRVGV